jgi:hypothetical protein
MGKKKFSPPLCEYALAFEEGYKEFEAHMKEVEEWLHQENQKRTEAHEVQGKKK